MRRTAIRAHLLALSLITAATLPAAAAGALGGDRSERSSSPQRQTVGRDAQVTPEQNPTEQLQRGKQMPHGPNPWLSLLSDEQRAEVDFGYWKQEARDRSAQLAARRSTQSGFFELNEVVVEENEPDNRIGRNDTQAKAQPIKALGTGRGDTAQARIRGTLAAGPGSTRVVASVEDDGAIPLANETRLRAGRRVDIAGRVGDGPHGSGGADPTGDFDHFLIAGVRAGDQVVVDVDTPGAVLDSTVTAYDEAGTIVGFNDDDGQTLASLLRFTAPADGDYVVAVAGFDSIQLDPFDAASGTGTGSEGPYTASIGINVGDVDVYSFDLAAGDVVSAKVADAASQISVLAPDGTLVIGSTQDASFIYPAVTPLTGGGNAVLDHVAATDGRHALVVTGGTGDYEATIRVLRPGFEHHSNPQQTIFLDFDGEELNTAIFGGPGVRTLSPLAAFLDGWGLDANDEEAVIDVVVATVKENLRRDLRRKGTNPASRIRVLNSDDHRDKFGRPNVSRVIIGGTIAESGVGTIGIAQSIDPGNYGRAETALVLLDILSEPATGYGDPSLNNYLRGRSDTVDFVGRAIGNVVSHEIGHFIGSWHADQFNGVLNLMDQGGNFPALYGVGRDNTGGTSDDRDVDFGVDTFNPGEGFTGFEDTLNRSAWASG